MKLSIDDLKRIREEAWTTLNLRGGTRLDSGDRFHLLICAGTACFSCGSLKLRQALESEIQTRHLADEVKIIITGCNGFCAEGPIMVVYPEGIFYSRLKPENVPRIVEEHLIGGRPVPDFFYKDPVTKKTVPRMRDISFFSRQVLRVLRNRSVLDPENIFEYIARHGYRALHKALSGMTPEQIVSDMKCLGAARTRGRRLSDRRQMGGGAKIRPLPQIRHLQRRRRRPGRLHGPFDPGSRSPRGARGDGDLREGHRRPRGISLCPR